MSAAETELERCVREAVRQAEDRAQWAEQSAHTRYQQCEKLAAEIRKLEDLAYAPGDWICDTCGFIQSMRVWHVPSGAVGASEKPPLPCPNDGQYMRRYTWREIAESLEKRLHPLLRFEAKP